ncbi:hypothetical protein L2E82_19418 [Cichorium intybus]|uniref:Uncharacterized protein n=1 Tax=Cichorium intybus TaxID=13427 RepID=A0ACB9FCK3_CICIN|nr:hypothetical protein L2E82_19418 [Cichorium intybus]
MMVAAWKEDAVEIGEEKDCGDEGNYGIEIFQLQKSSDDNRAYFVTIQMNSKYREKEMMKANRKEECMGR